MSPKMANEPADAIKTVDWDALAPRLVARARRYLHWYGWLPTSGAQPSQLDVHEVLSEAVRRVLSGQRNWIKGHEGDIERVLCSTMRSVVMDEVKKVRRRGPLTDEADLHEHSGETTSKASDDDAPIVNLAKEAAGDDEDCQLYLLAVDEGNTKREDIAAALEWTPEKVSVIAKKLQRRIARLRERTKADQIEANNE